MDLTHGEVQNKVINTKFKQEALSNKQMDKHYLEKKKYGLPKLG